MIWKLYLKALRPFSFPASILPITIASLWHYNEGVFDLGYYLLTLLCGVAIHGGTNLTNDYFDFINGVDTAKSFGSSKTLPLKILKPYQVMHFAVFMFGISLVMGLILGYLTDPRVLVLTMIGIIGGYSYTGPPFQLKYHALGIPLVFMMMGPLMMISASLAQNQGLQYNLLVISIPVGLMVAAILLVNDIRDAEWDKKSGVITIVVLFGHSFAQKIFLLMGIVTFVTVIFLIYFNHLNIYGLSLLFLMPFFGSIYKTVSEGQSQELLDIDVRMTKLHTIFGGIIVLSILIP